MIERYYHCVFVCSDYTTGRRQGLHFLFNETNLDTISDISDKYSKEEGVSMYTIITDKPSIDSIKAKDKFFETIEIKEGALPDNVSQFDKALRNQVGIFDLAFLLLAREEMNICKLRTYLLICYCLYIVIYNEVPFKEKYYITSTDKGFKDINKEFSEFDNNQIVKCTKTNVIISKFFNSEEGTKMMYNFLMFHYKISNIDFKTLRESALVFCDDAERYFNTDIRYRKRIKKDPMYLTAKVIKKFFLNSFPYFKSLFNIE